MKSNLNMVVRAEGGKKSTLERLVYINFKVKPIYFNSYDCGTVKKAFDIFASPSNVDNLKPLFFIDKAGKIVPLNQMEETK